MQDSDDISIGIIGLAEWEIPEDQTGRGLTLQTTRGPINTIVHHDPDKPANRGVIWVGGARGGFDTDPQPGRRILREHPLPI
jgi:hypothetical protein